MVVVSYICYVHTPRGFVHVPCHQRGLVVLSICVDGVGEISVGSCANYVCMYSKRAEEDCGLPIEN